MRQCHPVIAAAAHSAVTAFIVQSAARSCVIPVTGAALILVRTLRRTWTTLRRVEGQCAAWILPWPPPSGDRSAAAGAAAAAQAGSWRWCWQLRQGGTGLSAGGDAVCALSAISFAAGRDARRAGEGANCVGSHCSTAGTAGAELHDAALPPVTVLSPLQRWRKLALASMLQALSHSLFVVSLWACVHGLTSQQWACSAATGGSMLSALALASAANGYVYMRLAVIETRLLVCKR